MGQQTSKTVTQPQSGEQSDAAVTASPPSSRRRLSLPFSLSRSRSRSLSTTPTSSSTSPDDAAPSLSPAASAPLPATVPASDPKGKGMDKGKGKANRRFSSTSVRRVSLSPYHGSAFSGGAMALEGRGSGWQAYPAAVPGRKRERRIERGWDMTPWMRKGTR